MYPWLRDNGFWGFMAVVIFFTAVALVVATKSGYHVRDLTIALIVEIILALVGWIMERKEKRGEQSGQES